MFVKGVRVIRQSVSATAEMSCHAAHNGQRFQTERHVAELPELVCPFSLFLLLPVSDADWG